MTTLRAPWFTEDAVFLRDAERPKILRRLPSPPILLSLGPGRAAFDLTLFRFPPEVMDEADAAGGAVASLIFDFGAPSARQTAAEAGLPPGSPGDILPVHLASGEVALWLGTSMLSNAPLSAGHRPIVPLSFSLHPESATLLVRAAQANQAALAATATATLSCRYEGAALEVEIDPERVAAELAGKDLSFPLEQVGAIVQRLIEIGAVRVRSLGGPADEAMALAVVLAAGVLFLPSPGGEESWSAIPGLTGGDYRPGGAVRLFWREPQQTIRFHIPGEGQPVEIPWFAAAPVPLDEEAVRRVDLPAMPIQRLQVFLGNESMPPGLSQVEVELELPDGSVRRLPLDSQARRTANVRFRSTDGRGGYRWRLRVEDEAGRETVEEWRSADDRILVVMLRPVAPVTAA